VSTTENVARPATDLARRHAEALEARGLDIETCLNLGIVSALVPGGGEWIAIPFVKNGRIVNHKYRRLDEKDFRQDKGGEQCWWNHDCLLDPTLASQPLVVTEGEFDAIAAMQAGFPRVLSVPGGAPDKPVQHEGAKYAFLADSLPLLKDCRNIILATDGDKPGVALMNDLAMRLGRGRCKYVEYPEGTKDLCDVLLGFGEPRVVEALNTAKWTKVSGLYLMSELPPIAEAEPHDTGMPGLSEHYRIRRGDFCVITGIPGHGKSTWVNDLVCRTCDANDWRAVFASFEQHPQLDHKRALVRWKTGSSEGGLDPIAYGRAEAWIDSRFSFVVPDPEDDADATLEWLLDKLASAVVRYGAEIAVIDPWNELDHARSRDQSLTEYVGWAIRQLKQFARLWNVHLIVVAHPTKLQRDKDGAVPMPTLYDISDSSHWFNKPEVGIIVHRAGAFTQVRVAKSRYHDIIGKPGLVEMTYDERAGRYAAP
jgi:twinkle protein